MSDEKWIADAITLCTYLCDDSPIPPNVDMIEPGRYSIGNTDGTGAVVTDQGRIINVFVRFNHDKEIYWSEFKITKAMWRGVDTDRADLLRNLARPRA